MNREEAKQAIHNYRSTCDHLKQRYRELGVQQEEYTEVLKKEHSKDIVCKIINAFPLYGYSDVEDEIVFDGDNPTFQYDMGGCGCCDNTDYVTVPLNFLFMSKGDYILHLTSNKEEVLNTIEKEKEKEAQEKIDRKKRIKEQEQKEYKRLKEKYEH